MELDFFSLIVILFSTLLCFWQGIKGETSNRKLFLCFVYAFVFLYSGVGGALKEVPMEYSFYYIAYIVTFTFILKRSSISFNYKKSESSSFTTFINRNATKFIGLYFLLKIISLAYPENHLSYLISPPPPSLMEHDFSEEGGTSKMDAISALIYFMVSILIPFFYWSLYKYQKQAKYVILLLLINLYLTYCVSGYVGRGTILFAGILAFLSLYRTLSPRRRKILLASLAIMTPLILIGFYNYSLIRMGQSVSSDSFFSIFEILLLQEIGYPTLYTSYAHLPNTYIYEYFEWLLLLPLPGFLKFGYGNFELNKIFSINILGLDPSDESFFVLLPGVIGESIFVFGPYFFLIHAILLAVIMRCVMNTLDNISSLIFVLYYYMIQFSFMLARAGTISIYPSVFKFFVILIIVLYNIKRRKVA